MHGSWNHSITHAEAARIAADINRQGYGTLSNYVSEEELEPIRAIARAAVRASGGEFVFFTGPDAFAGTVLGELPQSAAFKELCRRLYELGVGATAPEIDFYQIFRCLQGATGQSPRQSYYFHYDAYVLTTLLPVEIPDEGLRGDLLIIPNMRPIRRSYLFSLVEHYLVTTRVVKIMLRIVVRRKILNSVAIRLQPGNMYFFWGYRSIHANEPCDPDKLRATALFHYGHPYQNSKARTIFIRMKGMRRTISRKLTYKDRIRFDDLVPR